jgi:hypothetical protein
VVDKKPPKSLLVDKPEPFLMESAMNPADAKAFLEDQLPSKYQRQIPGTLNRAYEAAKLLVSEEPMLQTPQAAYERGRIIAWSTAYAFERLVKGGWWPFDYRWTPFAQPTGYYLEFRFSHSCMSICQVANPKKQPRDVVFRQNARVNNQPFFNLPEFQDENDVRGLPHWLLLHGYQELTFAHIGLPNRYHRLGFIHRTDNLLNAPHTVETGVTPTENTDYEEVVTLKEEIERWRRDNGQG